jgi:hypothetical protein
MVRKVEGIYRTLNWVTHPVVEDGVRKVEGDWEEWVVPELKSWIASQESHPLDQNYFNPARMQGAVRNNFCIFRVLPDEANTTQVAKSFIVEEDENGKHQKPLRVLKIEPEDVFAIREEEAHAATYPALFNDEDQNETVPQYRIEPWKLMPLVFENNGDVIRIWWLSIGKAKVTTDTARLREEYESGSKTMEWDARLVQLRDAVLSQESLRELQAEWEKILKGFKLHVLKRGTRETREIPTTRRTTKGRTIRVEHDSTSGVKVNTLRQREIRRGRKAAKKTDPLPEGELLSKYVDGMSPSDADPICRGGCFALVQLHHLELKRLGAYSTPAKEVWVAFALERRKSIRNAIKYERKAANRNGLSQEVLQGRINHAKSRVDQAFDHAEVFRRRHCIDHG